MSIHDFLHLAAVGLAGLAAVLHPGWRRRGSAIELVVALVMLVAMIDAAYLNRMNAVMWSAVLLVVAMTVAAARSRRRQNAGTGCRASGITTHDLLGLVATAALLPLMYSGSAIMPGVSASSHATHLVAPGALVLTVMLASALYVIGSLVACIKCRDSSTRLQFGSMGIMTAVMAISVVT